EVEPAGDCKIRRSENLFTRPRVARRMRLEPTIQGSAPRGTRRTGGPMRFRRALSSGALARAARFALPAVLLLACPRASRGDRSIVEPYPPQPASAASAYPDSFEGPPTLVERDLSGPRFGVTIRPEASSRRLVSQFGWHFEHHISAIAGGPQFLTEFVPLVAG